VKLVVQPEAEADIVNAADWYDDQSRSIRQKFLDHVENALHVIEQHPHRYQKIFRQVRRVMVREFPYALLYIASDSEVNVIACSHCSRDPKRWQKRLRK
jgi:plasmid stabilization system protein ParE